MRAFSIIAAAVLAGSLTVAVPAGQADAATKSASVKKTKLGCIVGKERWNASVGKCMAAKPVKKAKSGKA